MEKSPQTVILGAGISGLCIAHKLTKSGHPCHLLETSHQAGGAIQSTREDGFLAEHGPNSLLLKDRRISDFINEIGLDDSKILNARPDAHNRFIVKDGRLQSVPTSPLALARSPLFGLKATLRIAKEVFTSRNTNATEESFAEFVKRRLGHTVLTNAAAPFVSGIYAGDPSKLSICHAFPRLWAMEQEHRSMILGSIKMRKTKYKDPYKTSPTRTISFPDGLATLPNFIGSSLPPSTLHLECQIKNITPTESGWQVTWTDQDQSEKCINYRRLIIATPHHRLNNLPLPSTLVEKLDPVSNIESPPVTSLVLGFKTEQIKHPLNGFGMLIRAEEKSPLLGVLFSSSMFEHRAPEGHVILTCMMGGTLHPEHAKNSDDIVLAELNQLLGVSGAPVFRHRTHWEKAIPQYNLGYQKILDTLVDCENSYPNLHFLGNYRGGISVTDSILNSLNLGKQLLNT